MWNILQTRGARFSAHDHMWANEAADAHVLHWIGRFDSIRFGPGIVSILGMPADRHEMPSVAFLALVHPQDRDVVSDTFSPFAVKRPERFNIEFRLRQADNAYVCLAAKGQHFGVGKDGEAIGLIRDITQEKRNRYREQDNGLFDTLTDLPRPRLFRDRVETIVELNPSGTALALIEIDQLPQIREEFGLIIQDSVVMVIGKRLQRCTKGSGTIGRTENDGFGALFTGANLTTELEPGLERIRRALFMPIRIAGQELAQPTSIGAAIDADGDVSAERLFSEAQNALFAARRAGGDCVRVSKVSQ